MRPFPNPGREWAVECPGLLPKSQSYFSSGEPSRRGKAGALWETAFPLLPPPPFSRFGGVTMFTGKSPMNTPPRYQLATARASGG